MTKNLKILVTCGETSGDLHASSLVGELRKKLPGADILAFGGDQIERAGARLIQHIDEYSVMGFSSVLSKLPRFVRLERDLKRALQDVDLFIPVDYPGMNLRLAARAKHLGIPVLYYISPQVWAWGRGRIEKMMDVVDFMAVILPFEEGIYRDRGIPVEFVGHPFVEDHALPAPRDQGSRSGIGLLPGSRTQEVRRILPILLAAAERIDRRHPGETYAVGVSASVPRRIYERILSRSTLRIVLDDDALDVMARSRLLLVASGTATLQGALFETPLIIVYRLSVFNYLIARSLVKIEHVGLVNVILGEEICPEFIQAEARPSAIADRAIRLLENADERRKMLSRFGALRTMLAGRGGCRRVAEISEQLIGQA